jgi:hypothetical protein
LFPGLVTTVLAAYGLAARIFSRRLRLGLGVAVLVCPTLSLGFGMPGGWFPYGLLYDFAAGWQGIRTPGRIATFTTLVLGLLAAAGADRLIGAMRRPEERPPRKTRLGTQRATAALLIGAILAEAWDGGLLLRPVPAVPTARLGAAAPQFHLPSDPFRDPIYMFWSTEEFPPLVNGHSGFIPQALAGLRASKSSFPSADSVAALRRMGARTVVLHVDLARGTPWRDAASRPLEGLPLTRQEVGQIVLYELPAWQGSAWVTQVRIIEPGREDDPYRVEATIQHDGRGGAANITFWSYPARADGLWLGQDSLGWYLRSYSAGLR